MITLSDILEVFRLYTSFGLKGYSCLYSLVVTVAQQLLVVTLVLVSDPSGCGECGIEQ